MSSQTDGLIGTLRFEPPLCESEEIRNSRLAVLLATGTSEDANEIATFARNLREDGYSVCWTDASVTDEVDAAEVKRLYSKIAAVGFHEGAARIFANWIDVLDAVAVYDPIAGNLPTEIKPPVVIHTSGLYDASSADAGRAIDRTQSFPHARHYSYEKCKTRFWLAKNQAHDKWASRVAYSRTLDLLRGAIGPKFDLAGLFAEHLRFEFEEKDPDATMDTMVDQPYVNHIPTRTGGVGHELLKRFYKYHFIPQQPEDRENILISETVGADTVVLEIVSRFTHDRVIDHMLPGVAPTGKRIELPVVVIATFRGDRLYNEHIYWDQACLLTQLGILDRPDLPISGVEATHKLLDSSLPSNELMSAWRDSEGKPL